MKANGLYSWNQFQVENLKNDYNNIFVRIILITILFSKYLDINKLLKILFKIPFDKIWLIFFWVISSWNFEIIISKLSFFITPFLGQIGVGRHIDFLIVNSAR